MSSFKITTKHWLGYLKPPADDDTDKPNNQQSQTLVKEHEKQPSVEPSNAVLEPISLTRPHVGSALRTSSDADRKNLYRLSKLRKLDVFDVHILAHGHVFAQKKTVAKLVFLGNTKHPLYSLGATLPGCGLTLRHLKEISTLMDKHKHSLKQLALIMPKSGFGNFFVNADLSQYSESATKLTSLFNALVLLRNLKSLTLNINASAFLEFDQTLTSLAKTVRHLPKLRELSLGISLNIFRDAEMRELFYNLIYQDELESLALNISRSYRIADRTLWDAWANVSEIRSLKNLTIDISQIHRVDDKVIAHLGWALLDLKELKELNLKINSTHCTTESIVILLRTARELEHLERLTIHAAGCQKIDKKRTTALFTEFAEGRRVVATVSFKGDKPEFGLKGPHE
ncbi:hypothetical protein [Pandoraea oxalativorans]|uniref:Uncharacterized protein n=1 Tax=Pandoraea oxalativorans TaxID=573737 RepID=A0A0G3IFM7_9BURK|nr:hypothetical protein [Pandoraea oxalativorans]AKK24716.1 hypothetical protein MB84_28265 [Pandoraea oxalativorans]